MKLRLVRLDEDEEEEPSQAGIQKWILGDYSLKDLPYGPPPDLFAHPFLDPDHATIIYAPGGSGKGYTTVHLIRQLLSDPRIKRVGVLDYENHEREWGSRARAMGYTTEELERVKYLAPYGSKWGAEAFMGKAGALVNVAEGVRDWVKWHSISYLVIDSFSAATTSADQMGGEKSATEYFKALQVIGLPSLTLAHIAAASEKFPDKPFGSVFVRNWSRRMWAMSSTQEENTLIIEAKNTKANTSRIAPMQKITLTFHRGGKVSAQVEPMTARIADELLEILSEAEAPISTAQLVKAFGLRTGENLTARTAWTTLSRQPKLFEKVGVDKWRVHKSGTQPRTQGTQRVDK